jgi:hypothetical protein
MLILNAGQQQVLDDPVSTLLVRDAESENERFAVLRRNIFRKSCSDVACKLVVLARANFARRVSCHGSRSFPLRQDSEPGRRATISAHK